MPSLRSEKLVGAVSYADGQFDDARFGLALAQTFAQQGGELINYAKAVGFGKDSNGKLAALEVEDQLTGEHAPDSREGVRKLHRALRRPHPS